MPITTVSVDKVRPLRHAILRPNQRIEETLYPGDKDTDTIHYAYHEEDKILGVLSVYQQGKEELEVTHEIPEQNHWRFRGMAVEKALQGKGIGKELVNLMLEDLKTNTTKLVWCNARTTACGFYEKLGFEKSGPEFEIPGIGKHFIMIKVL